MPQIEQALCRGLKRTYSAYKGIDDLHVLRVWPGSATCAAGLFGASTCDIVVEPAARVKDDKSFAYLDGIHEPVPRPGVTFADDNILGSNSWVFPHELGHYMFDQCDEYVDVDSSGTPFFSGCPYRVATTPTRPGPACGHSLMSQNYGQLRAVCTDAGHGRDGPTPLNPPSGWRVALCSAVPFATPPAVTACEAARRSQLQIPSLDALDFSTADLDGHFVLEVMHVGGKPTRFRCQ